MKAKIAQKDKDLPDLEDKDVQDAASKIQAAFKGHQVRKGKMAGKVQQQSKKVGSISAFKSQRKPKQQDDDLPDLEDKDVQDAASKIQAAFKGHPVRKGKMAGKVQQ